MLFVISGGLFSWLHVWACLIHVYAYRLNCSLFTSLVSALFSKYQSILPQGGGGSGAGGDCESMHGESVLILLGPVFPSMWGEECGVSEQGSPSACYLYACCWYVYI